MSNLNARPKIDQPSAVIGDVRRRAVSQTGGARGGLWLLLRQLFDDVRFYKANKSAVDRGESRELAASPLQLEAMVPVLEGRLPLVLAANRATDILSALELARALKIRLVIVGGTEAWLVADELAAAKVPVLVTPSSQAPYSFEQLRARDDLATLLFAAKVPVIISSNDGDQNIRRLRQEAGVAVAYGLPHNEAVRAITSRPAETFGRSDLGLVAAGKRANVVLWSGDPLELSTIAERVFIGGEEQPKLDRQRALAERYLKRVVIPGRE